MGHVIEPPDPNSFIIRLRPDKLCETPGALVRLWRGPASRGVVRRGREKLSPYPIRSFFTILSIHQYPYPIFTK